MGGDANAAVEFALGAPFLLGIVVILLELSMMLTTRLTLEGALRRAVTVGTVSGLEDAERSTRVRAAFDAELGALVAAEDVVFEQMIYDDLGSVGMAEPFVDSNGSGERDPGEAFTDLNGNDRWDDDRGRPGAGGAEDIVRYRVRYPWRPMVSLVEALLPNGYLQIDLSQTVRNEP